MRILVFLLALLGGLACVGVGFLWKSAEKDPKVKEAREWVDKVESGSDWEKQARAEGRDPDKIREAVGYFRQLLLLTNVLFGAAALAVIGGLFALDRRGLIAGLLLLVAAAVPLYLAWRLASIEERILTIVGVATSPLVLSGLLSFLLRRKPT